ncbi:hypothetical protein D3C87_1475950 [compost metagenome]
MAQPGDHVLEPLAVLGQVGAARIGQFVALLVAFGDDRGVAEVLEEGQRGIDHARARLVEAAGAGLQRLDQFVAVRRLFLEQRQQQQLQVFRAELAAPAPAIAIEAIAPLKVRAAALRPETAAPAGHGVLAETMAAAVVGMVMMVLTEGGTEGKSKEMSHAALRCRVHESIVRRIVRYISYDIKSSPKRFCLCCHNATQTTEETRCLRRKPSW